MSRARPAEAAYARLARELREGLLQGRFPEGHRLPTEAELAAEHGLSRQTVRRAFQDLVSEGMVHRVPGRGTFPAAREGRYLRQFGSVDDLMSLSLDTRLEVLEPLCRRVDVAAAGRLRLTDDTVSTVAFRRLHDGVPFCATSVHLPPDHGRLLADVPELATPGTRTDVTVIGLLDSRMERPIADAEQSITAEGASATVAERLGCGEGEPVLRIDRLYTTTDGCPAELAISHFLPQQYSYRVRLRRSLR